MALTAWSGNAASAARRSLVSRDATIAAAVFVLAAIWGALFYSEFVKAGRHSFFYQSYFEPAIMLACGKGFLISERQPPALRAFLLEQTDRFSCDQLPPQLSLGTKGLYQSAWRYLMTAVGLTWRMVGISWSRLAVLGGVLFGATAALAYLICRQIAGRAASVVCAAALVVSTLQLTNLPNLRDYAKAPFTLALALILIAMVVRPWRPRAILLLSLAYGLVMGLGYGFRTDLLIDVPPFFITLALFMPGGVLRNLAVKIAAAALFVAGFLAAGWPIIVSVVGGGGCQWHAFLLGLTTPFNEALGVSGGAYDWGHFYRDEYMWTNVSSYAARFRPDLGYIDYCSHEYDVASWEYARQILVTFPADMVTRAYASVLHVLNLPFEHVDPPFAGHAVLLYSVRAHVLEALDHTGLLLASVFVLAISWSSLRLALFALFVIVYFGGYPAIQFLPRHYFPFELVSWVMLAFLVERAITSTAGLVRDTPTVTATMRRVVTTTSGGIRRMAACMVLVPVLLLGPLVVLRAYQNRRATRMLESYVTSPTAPASSLRIVPGHVRVPLDPIARALTSGVSPTEPGHPVTRFVEAVLDPAVCRPDATVTFRYDSARPDIDFSHTVRLRSTGTGEGVTRVFEAVYSGFQGVEVSDDSAGCLRDIAVLTDLDRLPLLLSAQLPSGWQSEPQYQRITRLR
jgi:hypothetical protein